MLVYNTTYQVNIEDAENLVIWLHEQYIPSAVSSGIVRNPRLLHILSHHDNDSECFSLQFEIKDSTFLHAWYKECGLRLNDELLKMFPDKVVGFPTLMEVID